MGLTISAMKISRSRARSCDHIPNPKAYACRHPRYDFTSQHFSPFQLAWDTRAVSVLGPPAPRFCQTD